MYITRRPEGTVWEENATATRGDKEYLEGSWDEPGVIVLLLYSGPCRPAIVPPPHGRILPGYEENSSCDTQKR